MSCCSSVVHYILFLYDHFCLFLRIVGIRLGSSFRKSLKTVLLLREPFTSLLQVTYFSHAAKLCVTIDNINLIYCPDSKGSLGFKERKEAALKRAFGHGDEGDSTTSRLSLVAFKLKNGKRL